MASHNFYQPIASTTWTINHNLGTEIIAMDAMRAAGGGVYEKIMPHAVQIVDKNTISVSFSTPTTGRVRVVAK